MENQTVYFYCKEKSGKEVQVKAIVKNIGQYIGFIENYNGDDLGNDLILEDFILDFEETGVEIF